MRAAKPKKGQESPVKRTQLWIFTPYFSKCRAFRTLQLAKHVFLELLLDNKAFNFSKRALRAVPEVARKSHDCYWEKLD